MSRLMSVSHTADAVIERRKTVTRRLGWLFLKPGDHLTLCRKVMGRKPGEPLERLAEVEVVSVSRIPVRQIDPYDIEAEGVPPAVFTPWADEPVLSDARRHALECRNCQRANWIGWFARTMRVSTEAEITRIEWRYL